MRIGQNIEFRYISHRKTQHKVPNKYTLSMYYFYSNSFEILCYSISSFVIVFMFLYFFQHEKDYASSYLLK